MLAKMISMLLSHQPPHQGALLTRDSHLDERKCYGAEQRNRYTKRRNRGYMRLETLQNQDTVLDKDKRYKMHINVFFNQLHLLCRLSCNGLIHHEQSIHSCKDELRQDLKRYSKHSPRTLH